MLEAKIQTDIVQYLQGRGLFFFSIPNEALGKASPQAMARMSRLKAMGLRAGTPDMCVILSGGRVLFLEVKADGGKLSEAQVKFHARLESLGHAVKIVRSVADVEKALDGVTVQ